MKTWYDMAPITARSPELLSRIYGFTDVSALADSIPQAGMVVDVGAGRSVLGEEVTRLRPDVNWINLDISFGRKRFAAKRQAKASGNLRYVAGDAVNLPLIGPFANRVFSNALLPHIALESPELAIQTFSEMAGLLIDDGEIVVNGL